MARHHPSFSDVTKCICGLPMKGHPKGHAPWFRPEGIGESWEPEKRGRALAMIHALANSHHTNWKSKAQIWSALQEFRD